MDTRGARRADASHVNESRAEMLTVDGAVFGDLGYVITSSVVLRRWYSLSMRPESKSNTSGVVFLGFMLVFTFRASCHAIHTAADQLVGWRRLTCNHREYGPASDIVTSQSGLCSLLRLFSYIIESHLSLSVLGCCLSVCRNRECWTRISSTCWS